MARKHTNDDGNILDCSTTPEKCNFNKNAGHLEPDASPEEISDFYKRSEQVAQRAAGKSSAVGGSKTKTKVKAKTQEKKPSSVDDTFTLADSIQRDMYPEEHPDHEDVDLYPVTVFSMNVKGGQLRTLDFYDGSAVSIEQSNGDAIYHHRGEDGKTVGGGELGEAQAQELQRVIKQNAYRSRGQAEFDDSVQRIDTLAKRVDPDFSVKVYREQTEAPDGGTDRHISVYGQTGGFTFIQKAHKDLDGNDRYFYGVVDNNTDDEPEYMKGDTRTSMEHRATRYLFALKSKDNFADLNSSILDYDGVSNIDKANTLFNEPKEEK